MNLENKDYLVTNDINGDVFAVVLKGDNILDRVKKAIQEEYCLEEVKISDVVTDSTVSFTVKDFENDTEFQIKLLTAFIY